MYTFAEARELAEEAIEDAEDNLTGIPVEYEVSVGVDADTGYWVADNGESVEGLTRAQAIEIIVLNLTDNESR